MSCSSAAPRWAGCRSGVRGTSGFSLFSRLRAGDAPGIWRFTLSTSCNHLLGSVFNQFGTLLVGGVLGPADAAVYRVSRQIGEGLPSPLSL
ncbi:hypothetical protein RAA17_19325 [Komagataeibacter rhaeticus]|nr:hypothetical protein [Komagataeibacter rhaeticus]